MDTADDTTTFYLVPRPGTFWRWNTDGQLIEWHDGRTIAFRGEINSVLTTLAARGLPPFEAIVLLLAACRDNWLDQNNRLLLLEPLYRSSTQTSSSNCGAQIFDYEATTPNGLRIKGQLQGASLADATATVRRRGQSLINLTPRDAEPSPGAPKSRLLRLHEKLDQILDRLDVVMSLPVDLRQTTRGKETIADSVFEATRRSPPDAAESVLQLLASGFNPAAVVPSPVANTGTMAEMLDALNDGLQRLDADQLRLRLTTGLEQEIDPADLELPPADRVRRLLVSLRLDPELAGVVALATKLLAAVHIPRALASPQDLPVGGVSDISNRGPLDRLLVSELAYDDETLTTRIALNEALYLRREAPSSQPPRGRTIIIDTGIRMWGIPRVFGVSVAMALAASADPNGPFNAVRPNETGVAPADLLTRPGLIALLSRLHPAPDPAAAVRAAVESDSAEVPSDVMIVTHDDVLADQHFRTTLREIDPDREWHLATVNRAGGFRLQVLGPMGQRSLCSAELDLDMLVRPPKSAAKKPPLPLRDPKADPNLPAIFAVKPFPLLLPAVYDPAKAVVTRDHGVFGVTHDRRLMQWFDSDKGSRQIADVTSRGRFLGIFHDAARGTILLLTHEGRDKLNVMSVRIDNGKVQRHQFNVRKPYDLTQHGGSILLMYRASVAAIVPGRTALIGPMPLEGMQWFTGRFYRGNDGYYAAAFAGDTAMLHKVTTRECEYLFDRPGDGPWQIFADWKVASVTGEPISLDRPGAPQIKRHKARVSTDGNRIVVHSHAFGSQEYFNLDLTDSRQAWQPGCGDPACWLTGDVSQLVSASVRGMNRFDAIYSFGLTFVVGRRAGIGYRLTIAEDRLAWTPMPNLPVTWLRFGPKKGRASFDIRTIEHPSGSRISLDRRGLLHFSSADATLPEISFALSNSEPSGWTSDGRTFGAAYFHEERPTMAASEVMELVRRIMRRLA